MAVSHLDSLLEGRLGGRWGTAKDDISGLPHIYAPYSECNIVVHPVRAVSCVQYSRCRVSWGFLPAAQNTSTGPKKQMSMEACNLGLLLCTILGD